MCTGRFSNGPGFFSPGSRGYYTQDACVRFGGFAPGLFGSREHPRASQAGCRRMTTQNRCSIVQYGEDSLASIRLSPIRCQPPHACVVCQPSPNRFVFTVVWRRHSKEGKDNSPAEEHGPPFAFNLHDNYVLSAQMYWTIDTKCNCRQSIGGQPKKYRSYRTKYIKIRERRRASRRVMSSSTTNVVVAAACRGFS